MFLRNIRFFYLGIPGKIMILYVYGKCSTCKTAQFYLKTKGVEYTLKEITLNPPSLEELQLMLKHQGGNLKKLFNTSGNLYKEMQLSEILKEMPLEEALTLLSQNGMLVKRPFLLSNIWGLTGFNEAEWSKALKIFH
jgi:arsenate reductase (glutaredoxin)